MDGRLDIFSIMCASRPGRGKWLNEDGLNESLRRRLFNDGLLSLRPRF